MAQVIPPTTNGALAPEFFCVRGPSNVGPVGLQPAGTVPGPDGLAIPQLPAPALPPRPVMIPPGIMPLTMANPRCYFPHRLPNGFMVSVGITGPLDDHSIYITALPTARENPVANRVNTESMLIIDPAEGTNRTLTYNLSPLIPTTPARLTQLMVRFHELKFRTCRDLFFFLLNARALGVMDNITHIHVEDTSSGTHTGRVQKLLEQCPNLRNFSALYCYNCEEERAKHDWGPKWAKFKLPAVVPPLVTSVTVDQRWTPCEGCNSDYKDQDTWPEVFYNRSFIDMEQNPPRAMSSVARMFHDDTGLPGLLRIRMIAGPTDHIVRNPIPANPPTVFQTKEPLVDFTLHLELEGASDRIVDMQDFWRR